MRSDDSSHREERLIIRSFIIAVSTTISTTYPVVQATEVDDPQQKESKTYEKCVTAASERNTKWTQYRVDVNKCRDKLEVPGKY